MELVLTTKIQYLKGVGPKLAEKFHKLGIETVQDLIFYWPRRYEDYTAITKIGDFSNVIFNDQFSISNEIQNSNIKTIKGRVLGISNKLTSRQHMKITEAIVEDGTGTIKLVWFNQPFLKKILPIGSEWIFRGKIDYDSFNQTWVMESPTRVKKPCIIPVYPTTSGLSSLYISKLISNYKLKISNLTDYLPDQIIKSEKLLTLNQAVLRIHTPDNFEQIEAARKRLAFDELFLIALRSRLTKEELKQESAPAITIDRKEIDELIDSLPYELTGDQKKAVDEILTDMEGTVPTQGQSTLARPMNRLLNGDVGSGKTIVAAIAALATVKAGYKVALMVPTEVLAGQHYETFVRIYDGFDISIGLLTSSMKKISASKQVSKTAGKQKNMKGAYSEKADMLTSLTAYQLPQNADIIIGTHALLQRDVELDKAGLIIVDEQHRFGVKQRALLKEKTNGDLRPHFLSMTATPIPRSLHLALFGDLDVSVINEKPKNRKEIKTRFVEPQNRMKAYEFIRAHIESGRQVFVICPLIEEDEELTDSRINGLFDADKKSVTKEYEKLSNEVFPEFRVSMLHGKMKSKEKEEILANFADQKSDILVSTSVIEVGIDVPNATVMMIEDAERFGLAQLHQFRGRVGRGEHQSFCFLFSNSQSQNALVRLRSLENISDGFKLAEIDLEMRGPGDIFGTMQSGQLELKMASISDRMLIEQASRAASQLVKEDLRLDKYSLVKEKMAEFETSKHME